MEKKILKIEVLQQKFLMEIINSNTKGIKQAVKKNIRR